MAKIGVQLYTLREFLKTEADIVSTLTRVKESGFSAVQLSGIPSWKDESYLEVFIATCENLGLDICATHVPFIELETDVDYFIKLHKRLGCRYVGIGRIIDEYRNNPSIAGYLAFAKRLNKIAAILNNHDLIIVYHNHEFEFMLFEGRPLLDVLIEHANVQMEIDVHWVWRGGFDPCDYLEKLVDKVDVIHLKDYLIFHDGTSNRSEIRYGAIGEGSLDIPKIINYALKANTKYMLIEQDDTYGIDPFTCLKQSYDYLVSKGFGVLF